MSLALLVIVAALLLVAIAVQVAYLRGLARAGVRVTRATKIVSYVNIALLAAVAVGLVGYGIYTQSVSAGM